MDSINNTQNDEISLKDLILKVRDFILEIKANFLIVAISCLLASVFVFFKHKTTPVVYNATLTYNLHNSSNSGSSFPGILGSFGLGGGGNENLDKLLELTKSHRILKPVLFQKITIDGKNDFIANHIIRIYDFENTYWPETSLEKGFYFQNEHSENWSIEANKAFKTTYSHTIGHEDFRGLFSTSYSEDSGIAKISSSSLSAELSVGLTNNIFIQLDSFYVKNTTEKEQLNVDVLKSKTDSLYKELKATEYNLASFKDNSLRLQRKTDLMKTAQYEGKIRMLYAALAKATENLELADYSLRHQTPFIQVIDEPLLPLSPSKPSLKKRLVLGIFFALFFSVLFIVLRKIYRDIMFDN